MGKIFLLLIGIILILVFAGLALLGFLRRLIFSFFPSSRSSATSTDDSILYDDGKTTVLTSQSHDRSKRRS
ncbi:MAG: hypothetical protein ACK5F4_00205 [Ignavibacteria bacterium]|nr:hypothetical protein LBMAG35_07840 [Chlorobiota bacterium]